METGQRLAVLDNAVGIYLTSEKRAILAGGSGVCIPIWQQSDSLDDARM